MTFEPRPLVNPGALELDGAPLAEPEEFRSAVADELRSGRRLAALFARTQDKGRGLCAILADDAGSRLQVYLSQPLTAYPALTSEFPEAHLFERELFESAGVRPEGHPWLKPVRASLPDDVSFFQEEGEEVHEVAVGPVHAGVIEPGHFRFQCHGEVVHHLEIQLGYQHRGVEALLKDASGERAACLAESIAGDAAVGHALAHCLALEALGGGEPTPRGEALRLVGLELERLANHTGDLGALANDVGYLPATAHFGRFRGEFLNLLLELCGNRFGRGLVRPGGAAFDVAGDDVPGLRARLVRAAADLDSFVDLLFTEPSVQARFEETGAVSRQAAADLGLVGPAARACGLALDVRRDHPWGAYRRRAFAPVVAASGDVEARAQVRAGEARRSLDLVMDALSRLPAGQARAACPPPRPGRLAVAMVECWRGEALHAVETGPDGRVRAYKVVDPSFHNWMGLAWALRGGEISDFPLCNKSFNLSYAGHDL